MMVEGRDEALTEVGGAQTHPPQPSLRAVARS